MPGPSKPNPRRLVWSLARALVRMSVTAVDRGAALVRSSTRGLQEIYEEARDEYEAEKAAAHSARISPIAEPMPGSVLERVAEPAAGGRGSRKNQNESAPGRAARRSPGRPRKDADTSAPAKSTPRRRAAAVGDSRSQPEAPRRGRGRPRRVESEDRPAAAGGRAPRKSAAAAGTSGRRRTGKSAAGTSASGAGDGPTPDSALASTDSHAAEGAAD